MAATSETNPLITRLTPFAEALAAVDAVKPVAARKVAAEKARGRTLAADVVVAAAHPARWTALHDGWAVLADETIDASVYSPIPLSQLPERIEVGEPLPAGTDAVAPPDAVVIRNDRGEALALVTPGEGVLATGHDCAPSTTLRRAGRSLRGTDMAVLAVTGISDVQIREPRVRIVSARGRSDLLIQAAAELLARDIDKRGGISIMEEAGDNALAAGLRDENADAVIAIGGTGSGRHDGSVQTLSRAGRLAFHGIAFTPGETTAFGFAGAKPVLLLPGRLDAALAVWLTLGRRMMARLSGSDDHVQDLSATLTRKVASTVGLVELVPVSRSGDRVEPLATKYLPLSALTRADGWILVPAESEGYPAGATVSVRAWP